MNNNKNKWKFLKKIPEEELKKFLSSYNIDKNDHIKEIFEIQNHEDEFRIDLYNFDIKTNNKTKISYIDFLSDFWFIVECKTYDSRFIKEKLLELFIKKFGVDYIENYLEDYKAKLEEHDEQVFSTLLGMRTLSSMNLSNKEKFYKQAVKLHKTTCNQTKKILNSLYKETEKEIYKLYNEVLKNNN